MTNLTNTTEANNAVAINSVELTTEKILASTTLRVYKHSFKEDYDNNGNEVFYIFDSKNFEKVRVCDCYGDGGREIDCEMAGCNSFENPCMKSNIENPVSEDDFETEEDYEKALREQYEEQIGTVHKTVLAHTYWDGNNFATLTIKGSESSDGNNEGLEELDDDVQAKILLEYENKEFVSERFGLKNYESENNSFEVSFYQGAWWDALVSAK